MNDLLEGRITKEEADIRYKKLSEGLSNETGDIDYDIAKKIAEEFGGEVEMIDD